MLMLLHSIVELQACSLTSFQIISCLKIQSPFHVSSLSKHLSAEIPHGDRAYQYLTWLATQTLGYSLSPNRLKGVQLMLIAELHAYIMLFSQT